MKKELTSNQLEYIHTLLAIIADKASYALYKDKKNRYVRDDMIIDKVQIFGVDDEITITVNDIKDSELPTTKVVGFPSDDENLI